MHSAYSTRLCHLSNSTSCRLVGSHAHAGGWRMVKECWWLARDHRCVRAWRMVQRRARHHPSGTRAAATTSACHTTAAAVCSGAPTSCTKIWLACCAATCSRAAYALLHCYRMRAGYVNLTMCADHNSNFYFVGCGDTLFDHCCLTLTSCCLTVCLTSAWMLTPPTQQPPSTPSCVAQLIRASRTTSAS